MPDIVEWLKDDGYARDGFAYQTIMNHTYKEHTDETGKSMAMRLLIHFVGDFHQPLHCGTRVNEEFPKGDRGGNDFKLTSEDQRELHAVWDSILLEYLDYAKLPFSDDDWTNLGEIAQRFRDTYTIDASVSENLNVFQWAADDYKIVSEFLYEGINQNETLPDSYREQGRTIAEK